jgi:hypothetical protein
LVVLNNVAVMSAIFSGVVVVVVVVVSVAAAVLVVLAELGVAVMGIVEVETILVLEAALVVDTSAGGSQGGSGADPGAVAGSRRSDPGADLGPRRR